MGLINYIKTNWVNGQAPALSADNLNKMEAGIKAACDAADDVGDMGDYVIERGSTADGWRYAKWKSGWCEMLGSHQYSGMSLTKSSAGTYYGNAETITVPDPMKTIVHADANKTGNISSGTLIYEHWYTGKNITTNFRAHSSISSASCGVRWHVYGYWK